MKEKITQVVAVHYSPGGTGRKVLRAIGKAICQEAGINFCEIDMMKVKNSVYMHHLATLWRRGIMQGIFTIQLFTINLNPQSHPALRV